MSAQSVETFIRLLKKSPSGDVFNPWWQIDKQNDIGRNAPGIRRRQLRAYFCKRLKTVRLAVIGEALGYRGGHFSGIPMTSERILLGKKKNDGIESAQVFSSIKPHRTSKPERYRDGFSEPTATIVWSTLLKLGVRPQQFVLWNAFPWHSFDLRRGRLSNRTPNKSEQATGLPILKAFLNLFPCDEIVALGNVAASQLKELNIETHRVVILLPVAQNFFASKSERLWCNSRGHPERKRGITHRVADRSSAFRSSSPRVLPIGCWA